MHCEKTSLKAVSLVLDAVDWKCMFVLAQNLQLTTEQSERCLWSSHTGGHSWGNSQMVDWIKATPIACAYLEKGDCLTPLTNATMEHPRWSGWYAFYANQVALALWWPGYLSTEYVHDPGMVNAPIKGPFSAWAPYVSLLMQKWTTVWEAIYDLFSQLLWMGLTDSKSIRVIKKMVRDKGDCQGTLIKFIWFRNKMNKVDDNRVKTTVLMQHYKRFLEKWNLLVLPPKFPQIFSIYPSLVELKS